MIKSKRKREAEALVSWRVRIFVKGFMKRNPNRFGVYQMSEQVLYEMVKSMVEAGEIKV